MSNKYLAVTTEGVISVITATNEDSLSKLQEAVGGWVQAIDLSDTLSIWCNEEGKLINLPHNPYAQVIWDEVFGAHTDYIVGDVVFTGGTDDEGYTLGISDEQEQRVRQAVAKAQQFVLPRVVITTN